MRFSSPAALPSGGRIQLDAWSQYWAIRGPVMSAPYQALGGGVAPQPVGGRAWSGTPPSPAAQIFSTSFRTSMSASDAAIE